jgi:HEAT repeat protein
LSQFKGSTLAPAVPALADALSDGDGPVRKCAAYALSDAEIADPTGVVPKVIAALASAGGDAGFVWALLQSLSRCGPAAAAAVPAVEAFLDSPDRNIGLDAAECLVRLGAGPRAIPFLRSVLHTAAGPLGRLAIQTAARVLPACGPEGVDALRSALSSARPETRRAAAEQLVPRDPSAVASLVRECLNSASAEERGWAADLCAKSRALIGLVFMDLLALTGTPDARFRHQVFRLLAQTRPPAAAVPAFVAMLEDSYRRYFAMERLADMGRDAAAAIPPLERLAASPAIGANKPLVRSAREAVQRIRADLAEGRPS